jgi:hypothetical protein
MRIVETKADLARPFRARRDD